MSTVNNRPGTPLVTQLDNDDEIYAMRVVSDRAELVRARVPALFAPGQGSTLMPYVRSGNLYYRIPVGTNQSAGSVGAGDGTGNWVPMMVPVACTLTEVGVDVKTVGTAGAGSLLTRLGLWADNVTTPGIPEARIQDFGTVANTATGVQMLTGLSVPLQPYVMYFISHHFQGAPTSHSALAVFPAAAAYGSTNTSNYMWSAMQGTIAGALPATATGIVSLGSGGGAPAHFLVRLSY